MADLSGIGNNGHFAPFAWWPDHAGPDRRDRG